MKRDIFEELRRNLENKNLTREEKENLIKKAGEEYSKQVNAELRSYLAKQYAGVGLEIASAALPMGGVGKIGGAVGKELLAKQLGRKISKNIGSGIMSGAVSGGLFSIGESLIKDKNPIQYSLEGLIGGAITGGTFGAVGANIQRAVRGNQLRNYADIDNLSPELRKLFNNESRNFYKDYIQDIRLNKDGSTFDFTQRAMKEQSRWNPKQAQNYSELVKDIKNSKRLPDVPNLKPEQKPNVSHYEVYQGKNGLHLVEVAKNGEKRFYITKDTPNGAAQVTNLGPTKGTNNIIIDNAVKNNPAQVANVENFEQNSINPTIQGYIQKTQWDDIKPISPWEKQGGEPSGFAAAVSSSKIFTPEDIGKLTQDEFNKNEAIIMEQLRNGQIGIQNQSVNYENFKNPQSGKNRVFTREDLEKMTTDEYTKHEKEIMSQMNLIGIPYKNEVSQNTNTYSKEKANYSNADSKDGKWVTINGHHVFIDK